MQQVVPDLKGNENRKNAFKFTRAIFQRYAQDLSIERKLLKDIRNTKQSLLRKHILIGINSAFLHKYIQISKKANVKI